GPRHKAGDATYNPAAEEPQSLAIAKANQTITFSALGGKTFGDADFSVGATASSSLTVSFTAGATDQCTVTGTSVHLTGAGSCTITAHQAGDADYNAAADVPQTFAIAKAATVTSITVNDATFDGNPHGGTATVTGFGLSQPVTVNYAGTPPTSYGPSTTAPSGAGTYRLRATFAGDADHLASPDAKDMT